jgi:Flp pilus assembly pilin Flp
MVFSFIEDESGAITVDWVVLTAAGSFVGLAVMAVVSGGLESLSGDISDSLNGYEIQTTFASAVSALLSNDFSGGLGGFLGGTVANVVGFGEVLQLGPGEMTQASFAVPEGATTATITFDMLGVDDLSGEAASIMINGAVVALYADNHGSISTQDMSGSGISVSVNQQYSNDQMGSGSHGADSRATYTITIDNPGDSVTFGVASGTGQPISEEFYAIDDVNFTAG